jgi:hypothetical protein
LQAIGGAIVLAGIALVRADAGAPLVEPRSAEPADSELPTAA